MTGVFGTILAFAACLPAQTAPADSDLPTSPEKLSSLVRAEIRVPRAILPVGSQVIVEFVLQNRSDESVVLTVPGALVGKERPDYGMGLPLEHVFSGEQFRGLSIVSENNPRLGDRVARKPQLPVPPITLAPFASVGLRFDVARFYPGLHQSGIYELAWRPYGGALATEPIFIEVVQYKQVVIETEYGSLSMQLLYDKAPRHVDNFLELIEQRLYNGKTFHTVYANQFILGGCPNGDGTGRRPDGQCLTPEFNDVPFDVGTVGMALIESDVDSASCQFFICLSPQPAWRGRYTAFAQVRGPESLATLRRLGTTATDENRRPLKPLVIKSMSAVDAPHARRP